MYPPQKRKDEHQKRDTIVAGAQKFINDKRKKATKFEKKPWIPPQNITDLKSMVSEVPILILS